MCGCQVEFTVFFIKETPWAICIYKILKVTKYLQDTNNYINVLFMLIYIIVKLIQKLHN